jgi:hypothetical protein
LNVIKIIDNNTVRYEIEISKDYESLFEQYLGALSHASETKGKERHANDLPFEKQKICRINRDVGLGYGLGQIIKKAEEVVKLSPDRAIFELYGVINYASGLLIVLKEQISKVKLYNFLDCDCGICNYCNGVKNGQK